MGQKIHPLGFRVGITKRHQTVWFARFEKRQYAQTVLEDIFLKKTLEKLLPELLKKKYGNAEQPIKIANIKIERGLIPYEIGIQIYAQNCDAIKAAVDKLELKPYLIQKFLKNKFILDQAAKRSESVLTVDSSRSFSTFRPEVGGRNEGRKGGQPLEKMEAMENKSTQVSTNFRKNLKNETKFGGRTAGTGQKTFGRNFLNKESSQNTPFEKRLMKRKNTLERFRRRILENVLILKKGKKIVRKFQKSDVGLSNSGRFNKESTKTRRTNIQGLPSQRLGRRSSFSSNQAFNNNTQAKNRQSTELSSLGTTRLRSLFVENREQSQKTTKFMNIFLSKTNRAFMGLLKSEMLYWNGYLENYKATQLEKFGRLRSAPLGYQSRWSLSRLQHYSKQPLNILIKLVKVLQQQALKKLELLRREFVVLGRLSKTQTFIYFQRIRFIKALKTSIRQSKLECFSKEKTRVFKGSDFSGHINEARMMSPQKRLDNEKALLELTQKALKHKLTNLTDENRKIKFVEYLQDSVQKHRQKNLYLYLATIADARQYLKQIQRFTKEQANFLFGLNTNLLETMNDEEKREFVENRIEKAIRKANSQNEFQRNLQDVFVRQIQQQKTIGQKNLALSPKISLKFYSIKPEVLETNASIVADSIVDKLEKREAFRKVIKRVSEDLMKSDKVKGVKIQVSGRLNGAEIARSEWVRAGRVPLQTLRANIDYCYKTAQTIYGIIGVKVWIYKGYTQIHRNA